MSLFSLIKIIQFDAIELVPRKIQSNIKFKLHSFGYSINTI